jgi:hypothetical protein
MFLDTDIYSPNGTTYQVTTDDLDEHIDCRCCSRILVSKNHYSTEFKDTVVLFRHIFKRENADNTDV